jgi:hypothetical protein
MKEPEPEAVKAWEPILSIVFTFIVISVFNFNRQLIGIYYLEGNEWRVLPLFAAAFFRWLPLMNIQWIAEIFLNGMLLRAGRWEFNTRLTSIGIKILQVVIITLLLTGPSILAVTPESLATIGISDMEAAQKLSGMAHTGIRIVLGLAIFGTAIEIVKGIYKLITQRSSAGG